MERADDHISNNEMAEAIEWLEMAWKHVKEQDTAVAYKLG